MHLWIIKIKKIVELCGILAIIERKDAESVKELSKRMSTVAQTKVMRVMENGSVLSHERLSIIDLHSGNSLFKGVMLPMWFIMVRFTIIKH
jgi:asparagine synthase (glutamine-hydrolysing)